MSRTYIGPFGRILPVVDNSDEDSSGTEGQGPPPKEIQTDMATYQLPPPQIPTRLEFGSDPRPGFSEPRNYDISRQAQRSIEQRRQSFGEPRRPHNAQHGQLPPVSQLLTPGSQSSDAPSPYSTHQSPTTSENRRDQSSPRQPGFPSASPTAGGIPYQSAFTAGPYQVASYENVLPRGSNFAGTPTLPQYGMPNQPTQDSNMSLYTHPNAVPQPPYPSYPRQPPQITTMAAPTQHPPNLPGTYDYASNLNASSDPSTSNVTQSVKPLPRVLGEQDIPGEGPCWVYEDGSICRKVIDGELVNAQWGVTKAGKPRKRLAIACTTCREKKIKCDPGEGKCQQCEKVGRECRFTTA
ncbi:MAG: hypothetical protein Q9181_000394 [Wetmoreana brouardii]